MELSELTAYASEKYQIGEEHRWTDFPGFSVLCHPQTGKWIALLMRQWDMETGTEIQRCDLKCGASVRTTDTRPYLTAPIRMHGGRWVGISFEPRTERDLVFRLFDKAIRENAPHGVLIELPSLLSRFSGSVEIHLDRSVEIDIRRGDPGTGDYRETVLSFPGRGDRAPKEEIPDRLREMRRLYAYGRESEAAIARNFYQQARFMEDYEDDLPWSGEFVRYFPTYQDLTTRQLRGYFTWRAALRRGQFQPIPTSAAYLYVYELLNGVGASSPEDVLQKLRRFEEGYLDSGIGDGRMRGNLRRWMLEFAVVNDLPPELARKYADPEQTARDEALSVLRNPDAFADDAVFSALCVFGGKKLVQSPVITRDPQRGQYLFSEVWRTASDYRWQEKKLFALCFGERRSRRWYPFHNAVYYDQRRSEDRDYVLNAYRSYRCKAGLWTIRSIETLTFDKARFQGFLHETDARLRRYLKTGRYLKEKEENDWAVPYIDTVIKADETAQAKAARQEIEIDLSGLEQIRRDAAGTRDSLLTEDEMEDPEEVAAPVEEKTPSELPLDEVQVQILRALLRGEDPTAIIKANHLMPSIAADFINEALFDEIGDNVVGYEDDRLTLVADYIEDLTVRLGGTKYGGT